MEYTTLGKTDIKVSAVAMGCWSIVGDETWGEQDEAESLATIKAALDAGVTFFDTAEMYGNGYSERLLGNVLSRHRKEVVIASKVSSSHLSAEELPRACERSLQRLKTDTIDLYQIHWPSRTTPLTETLEVLEKLKAQGKIRAVGVSNFAVQDLAELTALGHCETNQLPYSLLWRAVEYDIQRICVENEIGILCYSPLAQGLLTGKFRSADEVPAGRARTRHFSKDRPLTRHGEAGCEAETFSAIEKLRAICDRLGQSMANVALAWLLHQSGVTSVIAGARRPDQIKRNADAADLKLAPEIISELTQATEDVKQLLGPNPDMWQSESRMR